MESASLIVTQTLNFGCVVELRDLVVRNFLNQLLIRFRRLLLDLRLPETAVKQFSLLREWA